MGYNDHLPLSGSTARLSLYWIQSSPICLYTHHYTYVNKCSGEFTSKAERSNLHISARWQKYSRWQYVPGRTLSQGTPTDTKYLWELLTAAATYCVRTTEVIVSDYVTKILFDTALQLGARS